MTNYIFAKRMALAPVILAASFLFSGSLRAEDQQRPPKAPVPETPDHRPMEKDATKDTMNDRNCKKIYRTVHHGPPGKGSDVSVLDRVECPVNRA